MNNSIDTTVIVPGSQPIVIHDNPNLDAGTAYYNSPESDKPDTTAKRAESRNNKHVYRIHVNGFKHAFVEVTRSYNPEKNLTTARTRLIAYDGKETVTTHKKTLTLVSDGDNVWHYGTPEHATTIVAGWYPDKLRTTREIATVLESVKRANSGNWGKNAVRDYLDSLRARGETDAPDFKHLLEFA